MIVWSLLACQGSLSVPDCDDSTDTACFRGVFRTLLGSPVEEVEICAPDFPELGCVLSDAEGGWKLPGFPLESNVHLTATHPDYVPSLFPQHTSMAWYHWYKVAIPLSVMQTNANQLDVQLESSKGQLLFLVWEGLNIDGVDTENVADVRATVAGSVEHLFYGNALNLASAGLSATSGSGSGGVLNALPGELSLQLEGPAGPCAQEHMFHYQAEDGMIPIPIRAGFTTAIDVICP